LAKRRQSIAGTKALLLRRRGSRWRTGSGAIHRIAGTQLLRRQGAEAIGEILLHRVDLLVLLPDLIRQFFIGAGGLREAAGQAPNPVLQRTDAFIGLCNAGILPILMRLGRGPFFIAGTEQLRAGGQWREGQQGNEANRDARDHHERPSNQGFLLGL
jgi:hypothetical protein